MQHLQSLVVAALLHDIGKVSQRDKLPRSDGLADNLCPKYGGRHSHLHVLNTHHVLSEEFAFPNVLGGDRERIIQVASRHHNADTGDLMQLCVQYGDRLAAGWDRQDITQKGGTSPDLSRLTAIFEEIELSRHEFVGRGDFFYKLKPFTLASETDSASVSLLERETIFPVAGMRRDREEQEYVELHKTFIERANAIPADLPFPHYLSWLLRVMEDHLWCVPSSSYKSVPDISLFDHSRMTAAVAQALWLYHQGTGTTPAHGDTEEKFLFCGGELSGIQDTLFEISPESGKGAAKLLRGRSFHIQAETQSVVLHILREFGLLEVAAVMNAGGKFILLLPNLPGVEARLTALQDRIDIHFRDRFHGMLSLSLAWMALTHAKLNLRVFHESLDTFNMLLDEAKLSRYGSLLSKEGHIIEAGYADFSDHDVCPICRARPATEKRVHSLEEPDVCCSCRDQIDYIGTRLPKAAFFKYTTKQEKGRVPLFEGIYLEIVDSNREGPIVPDGDDLLIQGVRGQGKYGRFRVAGYIPLIEEKDFAVKGFLKTAKKDYGENRTEKELCKFPKTFNLIAAKAGIVCTNQDGKACLRGRDLLALAKADVDSLGLILGIGLQGRLSLSRFASLSRMLDIFFAEWLVEIVKAKYPDTYVVYAGGDDLFLLGPWNQTLRLMAEIHKDFGDYCAANPDVSLSCGLHLTKSHTPLRRSVELASDNLEKAKQRREGKDAVKDGVHIWGRTLSWQAFQHQLELGDKLVKLALDPQSKISTVFLHRMLEYSRKAQRIAECDASGKPVLWRDRLYRSHAHYDISRNIARYDRNDKIKPVNEKEVDFLLGIVTGSGGLCLSDTSVALQYALNALRKKEEA